MMNLTRRDLLARSAGIIILAGDAAPAGVISGNLPWQPDAATPPQGVLSPTAWAFFTPAEAAAVEAIADRIIPPDPDTPGGKGAGCAVFIDRQLAGPYGSSEDLYNSRPSRTVRQIKELNPRPRRAGCIERGSRHSKSMRDRKAPPPSTGYRPKSTMKF